MESFKNHRGETISCFVRGDKAIVVKDTKLQGSF
jgi:hypothetical protein